MRPLDSYAWIALILVIIGGINWGLVGLADLNLVFALFGNGWFARIIYIIIGLAAAYLCYLIYLDRSKKAPTI
ncbi:MAG: DUF378 domain-containing protein [Gammaproteobacteria bacterium]|nr:DUF378 domain-containing protein [Gammaproteobacteria bacterium]